MVRQSKRAWTAAVELRKIDRDALPHTHAAFMLGEAVRATEELAMELEAAELGALEV